MSVTMKAALAAELGISPGRLSHYISDGMPVRKDKRLNREECIGWIADHYKHRSGGNGGIRRARQLLSDGYAGVERERSERKYCYLDDGSVEWYYIDVDGERVVERRQEAWEHLGFKSEEAYVRWLQRHRAA